MTDKPLYSQIIHPVSLDDFKSTYQNRAPLLVSRYDPDYYSFLFSKADFDHYFQRNDFRAGDLILYKGGDRVDFSEYCYFENGVNWIDMAHVSAFFHAGATVLAHRIERSYFQLGRFLSLLSSELGCNFSASGVFSPSGSSNIDPHFDAVDVFVLQISGFKRWLVYDSPHLLATHTDVVDPSGLNVLLDVELFPGDLLYIPRGYIHRTLESGSDSFHISILQHTFTWSDVFKFLASTADSSPTFRGPFNLSSMTSERFTQISSLLFEFFTSQSSFEAVVYHFESHLKSKNRSFSFSDLKF
jgi:hypothetical protein